MPSFVMSTKYEGDVRGGESCGIGSVWAQVGSTMSRQLEHDFDFGHGPEAYYYVACLSKTRLSILGNHTTNTLIPTLTSLNYGLVRTCACLLDRGLCCTRSSPHSTPPHPQFDFPR